MTERLLVTIQRLLCRLGAHSTLSYGGVVCVYCRRIVSGPRKGELFVTTGDETND